MEKSKINIKQFLRLVQLHLLPKRIILLVIVFSLLQTVASLVVPWFTKDLVNVITVQNLNTTILILLISTFLVQVITSGFSTYYLSYLGETVVANLRKQIWRKTLKLPIPYFDQNRSGELISRIHNDTQVIKELITTQLVAMFTGLISLVGALCILFYLDWTMTLVMLSSVPLVLLIMRPIGSENASNFQAIAKRSGSFYKLSYTNYFRNSSR